MNHSGALVLQRKMFFRHILYIVLARRITNKFLELERRVCVGVRWCQTLLTLVKAVSKIL